MRREHLNVQLMRLLVLFMSHKPINKKLVLNPRKKLIQFLTIEQMLARSHRQYLSILEIHSFVSLKAK